MHVRNTGRFLARCPVKKLPALVQSIDAVGDVPRGICDARFGLTDLS